MQRFTVASAASASTSSTTKFRKKCRCSPFQMLVRGCVCCPCLFLLLALAAMVGLVVVMYPGFKIETNFDSFLKADGDASVQRDVFLEALAGRASKKRRRLARNLYKSFNLFVYYEAPEGDLCENMLVLVNTRCLNTRLTQNYIAGPVYVAKMRI